jgi:hypothetical protein
VIEPLVQAL